MRLINKVSDAKKRKEKLRTSIYSSSSYSIGRTCLNHITTGSVPDCLLKQSFIHNRVAMVSGSLYTDNPIESTQSKSHLEDSIRL